MRCDAASRATNCVMLALVGSCIRTGYSLSIQQLLVFLYSTMLRDHSSPLVPFHIVSSGINIQYRYLGKYLQISITVMKCLRDTDGTGRE